MSSDTEYCTVEVTLKILYSHSGADFLVGFSRLRKSQENTILYVAATVREDIYLTTHMMHFIFPAKTLSLTSSQEVALHRSFPPCGNQKQG